jgi:hypothetical protein
VYQLINSAVLLQVIHCRSRHKKINILLEIAATLFTKSQENSAVCLKSEEQMLRFSEKQLMKFQRIIPEK